jgi:hypothetical protein
LAGESIRAPHGRPSRYDGRTIDAPISRREGKYSGRRRAASRCRTPPDAAARRLRRLSARRCARTLPRRS